MSIDGYRCGQCGGALAPADAVCAACGSAVAPEQRLALLGSRAEAFAADGLHGQAARTAATVLTLPMTPQDAKLWWRKRAAWLQRAGEPGGLDNAELSLKEALRLDDGDDLSHQLWIDLLRRQGRLEVAREVYQKRLEADPEDAVARRQIAGLRLMEDLKAAPVPKLSLPSGDHGILMKALMPTPYKMVMAGIAILFCLISLFGIWNGGAAASASLTDASESLGPILKLVDDPWLNVFQVVLYSGYLVWGWKAKPWRNG